jgi:protein-S-isoprenylcysteine O-methyltransferase Ste14
MRTSRTRALAAALVAVQLALLLAFFTASGGDDWTAPGWLATVASVVANAGGAVLILSAINLGRSLTAMPTPAERGMLKTTGLYRIVRHPLYTGLLALVLGRAVTSGSLAKAGLGAALFALLMAKARWEEQMLARRYPDYGDYAARTPRFLPLPVRRGRKRSD